MIRNTATKRAPWYVFRGQQMVHAPRSRSRHSRNPRRTRPGYPKVDAAKRKELAAARKLLVKKD